MAWESRLRVARDIAHAVAFLHTGFSRPVIHTDIMPENILFDQHDIPKLSAFGNAISIPEGETHVHKHQTIVTFGYSAPEYVTTGRVTEKIDVYSFGVLLLCLLTGEVGVFRDEKANVCVMLVDYVLKCGIDEIVNPRISTGERGASMQQQLQAVLDLALICVDEDPERRPTMVHVTKELRRIESNYAILEYPKDIMQFINLRFQSASFLRLVWLGVEVAEMKCVAPSDFWMPSSPKLRLVSQRSRALAAAFLTGVQMV
ncbi:hypothetical protein CJ030_MR8G029143 [Morella rubra]|uniref:Protein kinase domain-containing protein n=1 Tax=Morella rubra TaxID=262757 RepID=A0A6A1UNI9_9ROSI|nr:hypothetical protein CJ030_MR8G029143 [Morella rubra]